MVDVVVVVVEETQRSVEEGLDKKMFAGDSASPPKFEVSALKI